MPRFEHNSAGPGANGGTNLRHGIFALDFPQSLFQSDRAYLHRRKQEETLR